MTAPDLPAYFAREAALYTLATMVAAKRRSPEIVSYNAHRAAARKGLGKEA